MTSKFTDVHKLRQHNLISVIIYAELNLEHDNNYGAHSEKYIGTS